MKFCNRCGQDKTRAAFNVDRRPGRDLDAWCKECRKAYQRDRRAKAPDRDREADRERYARSPRKWERHILDKYGIDRNAYEQMLEQQRGQCAVCGSCAQGRLSVDHCHSTNAVRGLLCARCNLCIGYAKDSPDILRAAADYLIVAEQAAAFVEAAILGRKERDP